MFRTIRPSTRLLALVAMVAAALDAQGPASCGFHLEFIGGLTSTHAAVADMPSAPGSGTGMAPGAAGNPYNAYTTGGSPISLIISVPVGTLGSAPIGAGSCITLLYRLGAGVFPVPAAPPLLPTCDGSPLIIGVLPISGTIVDSCSILGSTPISTFVDPGWPNRFTLTGVYAPFAPPAVTFQAALITSGGNIAVTNAVTVFMGPNPNETSRLASLTPCGAGNALDDVRRFRSRRPPDSRSTAFPWPSQTWPPTASWTSLRDPSRPAPATPRAATRTSDARRRPRRHAPRRGQSH